MYMYIYPEQQQTNSQEKENRENPYRKFVYRVCAVWPIDTLENNEIPVCGEDVRCDIIILYYAKHNNLL